MCVAHTLFLVLHVIKLFLKKLSHINGFFLSLLCNKNNLIYFHRNNVNEKIKYLYW